MAKAEEPLNSAEKIKGLVYGKRTIKKVVGDDFVDNVRGVRLKSKKKKQKLTKRSIDTLRN